MMRRVPSRRTVALAALAAACLVLAHDAVFFVELGPGEALARALRQGGHGYWPIASVVLLVAGGLAALGLVLHVVRLAIAARGMPAAGNMRPGGYLRRAAGTWLWLFPLVAFGFAVQENVEHLATHAHLPWASVLLAPEHPLAVAVVAVITGIAAALGALMAGRAAELRARLAAVRQPSRRAARQGLRRPTTILGRPLDPMASARAGRAPPRWGSVAVA